MAAAGLRPKCLLHLAEWGIITVLHSLACIAAQLRHCVMGASSIRSSMAAAGLRPECLLHLAEWGINTPLCSLACIAAQLSHCVMGASSVRSSMAAAGLRPKCLLHVAERRIHTATKGTSGCDRRRPRANAPRSDVALARISHAQLDLPGVRAAAECRCLTATNQAALGQWTSTSVGLTDLGCNCIRTAAVLATNAGGRRDGSWNNSFADELAFLAVAGLHILAR